MNYGIILMLAGGAIMIFAHPKISRRIMTRLFNEGFVTPQRPSMEKTEILTGSGPAFTIFFLGFILFFIGLLLLLTS